jgi:peptidoglycan-associated lipoprotein
MLLKGIILAGILFIAACNKSSDINQVDEDYANPKQIEEGVQTETSLVSNFDSLPSAESISITEFIPDRVGFDLDKSDVSNSQKQILDAQIKFIKENMKDIKKIRVSGYCDERGSIEYNYALGERRANYIKKYFVKNNIPSEIIQTVSYGKEVVLVEGSFEEAYRQNRTGKITLCETTNC